MELHPSVDGVLSRLEHVVTTDAIILDRATSRVMMVLKPSSTRAAGASLIRFRSRSSRAARGEGIRARASRWRSELSFKRCYRQARLKCTAIGSMKQIAEIDRTLVKRTEAILETVKRGYVPKDC